MLLKHEGGKVHLAVYTSRQTNKQTKKKTCLGFEENCLGLYSELVPCLDCLGFTQDFVAKTRHLLVTCKIKTFFVEIYTFSSNSNTIFSNNAGLFQDSGLFHNDTLTRKQKHWHAYALSIARGLIPVFGITVMCGWFIKHKMRAHICTHFFLLPSISVHLLCLYFFPLLPVCLPPCITLLHHSQTSGAKVTGLWQRWWQCHSASRLSQYWHRRMWILPTNGCLSTEEACQPLSIQAKNLPTNDCWTLHRTNQCLPNHRMQVFP